MSSCKTSITTQQCICANGTVIPPAVLFPGLKFNLEYRIGFSQNFYLGFTQNVIAEKGTSINSEQSSPGNILPNSIPQMVEESFVSLPGGNTSIGKNISSASTPEPLSQIQKALKDLENNIGNKKHIFLNRFIRL